MAIGSLAMPPGVVSLPGLILYDMNKLRQDDQRFKEIKKSLSKFKIGRLSKIQKRYMKEPKKYKAEYQKVADEFLRNYVDFRKAYGALLKSIVDTLNTADQEQYEDLERLKSIVADVRKMAMRYPGRFYFPPDSRRAFHKEFGKALRALAAQLQEEYVTYQAVGRGKSVHWFQRFWTSKGSAERQGMRAAGKMQDQVKETKNIAGIIRKALSEAGSPDLPMQLIAYVIEQEKTDRLMKQFKKDAEIILEDVMIEVHKVVIKIAPFIVAIESDPNARAKMEKARNEFVAQQQEIERQLGKLTLWPKLYTRAQAQALTDEERKMLEILSKIGKKDVDDAINSVINREMGGRKVA